MGNPSDKIYEILNNYKDKLTLDDFDRLSIHNSFKSAFSKFEKCEFTIDYDCDSLTTINLYLFNDELRRFAYYITIYNGEVLINSIRDITPIIQAPSYTDVTEDLSDEMRDILGLDECDEIEEEEIDNLDLSFNDLLFKLGEKYYQLMSANYEKYVENGVPMSKVYIENRLDPSLNTTIKGIDSYLELKSTKEFLIKEVDRVINGYLENEEE